MYYFTVNPPIENQLRNPLKCGINFVTANPQPLLLFLYFHINMLGILITGFPNIHIKFIGTFDQWE